MGNIVPFRVKAIIFLILSAGILWLAFYIGSLVKLVVISALLAYILTPLVNYLESRGMGRTIATTVAFLGIISFVGIFVVLLLPLITDEIRSAQASLNSVQASDKIVGIKKLVEEKLAFLGIHDFNVMDKINQVMLNTGKKLFGYLLDAVSLVTNLVIIPFISFFLVKDSRNIKKQFIGMVPNRFFEFTLNLLHKMDLQLGNYIRGQLLDTLFIGILSITALWFLDVKYFIIIGAFAGLANLIPYIGPIVGAVPAILISLFETGDPATAGYIALAFLFVQLIDNGIIKPVVVAKSVNLHPLLVLLVVIIGGKFFGILGMILSIPLTGFLKVIVRESMINFRKYRFS